MPKSPFPPGSFVAVAALLLAATFVIGREDERRGLQLAAPLPTVPTTQLEPARAQVDDDLDLDRLKRPRREPRISDVFAPKPAMATQPPANQVAKVEPPRPEQPPPPPAPPELPYRYLGKLISDGQLKIFVAGRAADHVLAAAGQVIDGAYRVDEISEKRVVFTYLPLGARQELAIAAAH